MNKKLERHRKTQKSREFKKKRIEKRRKKRSHNVVGVLRREQLMKRKLK